MSRPVWPSIERQLAEAEVRPGSALEKLIQQNQDFHLLRPEEATDQIGLPLWLRVHWRKQHPELEYGADNPTGGYPRALKNLHAWMLTHQDLQPGRPPNPAPGSPLLESEPLTADAPAGALGTNLRISGPQSSPRSESDIRINYNNTNLVVAASNAITDSPPWQAQFYSSDGGASWRQTSLFQFPGSSDEFHSDPAVDWTSDGTAWAVTIGVDGTGAKLRLRAYRSADGGAT